MPINCDRLHTGALLSVPLSSGVCVRQRACPVCVCAYSRLSVSMRRRLRSSSLLLHIHNGATTPRRRADCSYTSASGAGS